MPHPSAKPLVPLIALLLYTCGGFAQSGTIAAPRKGIDVEQVISRSDIVLERPNLKATEAMPLGNGRLGAAIWSDEGLTAQLNRADTLPLRLSPGQVILPGLKRLTAASDYQGRLNLYDGTFEEHGGGMRAAVYIQPDPDALIIDVTGADPSVQQTATLRLWEPRHPIVAIQKHSGYLAESWLDDQAPGASQRRFGSLAVIMAIGRNVTAASGANSITLSFAPDADGHFRVVITAPHFDQETAAAAEQTVSRIVPNPTDTHLAWWHAFWNRTQFMKITSRDGVGEYMENLRVIYLYCANAERGQDYPGSQAGVADLFSSARDHHQWDASAFWHWNLRMQVAANLGAGAADLNQPYFHLYRDNLEAMQQWTKEHMRGAPGICIPETMRFSGQGIEYEAWDPIPHHITGLNCDADSPPYYNARTLTTGAEVSLWIWRQYLWSRDLSFLARNFPVMAESARFLLSYETSGPDGLRHTSPSNAHETQWDVRDPTTDLAARLSLYPATIAAAKLLKVEPELVAKLQSELPLVPAWPVAAKHDGVLALVSVSDADAILADSYEPAQSIHNVENIGLEPLWPYELIDDRSPLFAVAQRSFDLRPNKLSADWSFDAVQAARLHRAADLRDALVQVTETSQHFANGLAQWSGSGDEFYIEQAANVALALQESIVQDYDGVIRIAPAVPSEWDIDAGIAVRNCTVVDVSIRGGTPVIVGIRSQLGGAITLRNPWPGHQLRILRANGRIVPRQTSGTRKTTDSDLIHFTADRNVQYRIAPADKSPIDLPGVTGVRALEPKTLGPAHIGLLKSINP